MPVNLSDYYAVYDLKFTTGDYVLRRILIEDPDPDSPDPDHPVMIPRNLTGWSGRAQIRTSTKRDSEIVANIAVSLGQDDPTDGFVVLEVIDAESQKCIKNGGWDLELTDPDGHPETIMGGKVLPNLDYTHD